MKEINEKDFDKVVGGSGLRSKADTEAAAKGCEFFKLRAGALSDKHLCSNCDYCHASENSCDRGLECKFV